MKPNSGPSTIRSPQRAGVTDGRLIASWGVGTMTGMAASAIVFIGAFALGYVSFGAQPAGAQVSVPVLPSAPEMTASPTVLMEVIASATPVPPTIVPDYAATATQACSMFTSLFPGTPCPGFMTPTPGP